MKKKILFVMESLSIGGAEKSLITLLSNLDYLKYDVDLFLFYQKGEFLELLPKEVNLIEVPDTFKIFIKNPKESLNELIKKRKFKLFMIKGLEIINLVINKFILKKEYIGWNYIAKSINTIPKNYDVAIGFLEKKSIYFTVDKVNAKKKIGWIHTDYEKIENDYKIDNKYFKKIDNIVTVSNHCREVLINKFASCKSKVNVIQNIISPNLILKMANQEGNYEFYSNNSNIKICTVCRLIKEKGIDIAIECCEVLVKRGIQLEWIVVGEGSERENLQQLINERNLNDRFKLIGSRANPYPYIKKCDIYVQPSRYEGFGITLAEAKVLRKPIVASNIPEFIEQIENGITGVIYKDIQEMINSIENLVLDMNFRKMLIRNLKNINMDNINEIEKLEKLLE
ncbi:glycosyltransferase [Clostridium perfringens]|uniref:glycosyltransferase n=1 Tax=Clostridium perfringens TaxID=1502 RepID=UPI0018E4D190|nr:glycosyltransferase [Clostridium perfringens]MBI6080521.1 glycosyltransferase [Clostridium perfringens]MBI6086041.1 glycosyltransferase [Clostridium perfringens]MBI6100209.1 glycosyltransferase [Clostridium perfringens]